MKRCTKIYEAIDNVGNGIDEDMIIHIAWILYRYRSQDDLKGPRYFLIFDTVSQLRIKEISNKVRQQMGAKLSTEKITLEMFLEFSLLKFKEKNFFENWLESGPVFGKGLTSS